ncbi:MAG: hypothetical protein JNM56_00325 [Planctomycetia bacterium]|nr:hypothetical protein [Planctomycetia bacterium]
MDNSSAPSNLPSAQEVLQRYRSEAAAPEAPLTPSQRAKILIDRVLEDTQQPKARTTGTPRDAETTAPEPTPTPAPVRLTRRLVDRVRGDQRHPLTRFTELVRDVLIDWDILDDQDDATPPREDLPPMSPEAFVFALRYQMDETLRQVAEAINAAPTGDIIGGSEEQVCRLLAEFWAKAMERGVLMRLEAAEALLPPGERPKGEWARRLRRMLAGGGDMPLH